MVKQLKNHTRGSFSLHLESQERSFTAETFYSSMRNATIRFLRWADRQSTATKIIISLVIASIVGPFLIIPPLARRWDSCLDEAFN